MFYVSNENLPLVAVNKPESLPVVTLGRQSSAPFLKSDFYAKYDASNSFSIESLPLSQPSAIAPYYKLDLSYEILEVKIEGFTQLSLPQEVVPQTFWLDGAIAHICGNIEMVEAIVLIELPFATSENTYEILLPDGIAVSKVASAGLEWVVVESSPLPGEALQVGSLLTVKADANFYALNPGDELELMVSLNASALSPSAAIVWFDLSNPTFISEVPSTGDIWTIEDESEYWEVEWGFAEFLTEDWTPSRPARLVPVLQFVDALDYLGVTFNAANDVLDPQIQEFLWGNNWAKLFISFELGRNLILNSSDRAYQSTIETLLVY